MTGAEKGFLLLTSHLGHRDRKTLTVARFRELAERVRSAPRPREDRELELNDLLCLGCDREMGERILTLLAQEELLEEYLHYAAGKGCEPLTWASGDYPNRLRNALGDDAPGVIWMKGDRSVLTKPAISVVGSRDLRPLNGEFAAQVGRLAAQKGYVLISGNARGADLTAQEACLRAGGSVICVVADDLTRKKPQKNVLYLSEQDFDAPFSAIRAHSRNRLIHSMGSVVFVAQSNLTGGTWSGTEKNLRRNWSPVLIFNDGTKPVCALTELGAKPVSIAGIEEYL